MRLNRGVYIADSRAREAYLIEVLLRYRDIVSVAARMCAEDGVELEEPEES